MPVPVIQIRDATVRREGRTILHVEDFTLEEGGAVAILGPNGSGKSSFINLITREIFPLHRDNPPVLFRGVHNMTLEEVKLQIGFVSASMQQQITGRLTALEVVCGGLFGSLGVPKRFTVNDGQRGRAMQVMEELGIAELAGRTVNTLSTGQARRVLIARALIHNPAVVVFDEPCTGLDPNGMYYVRRTMQHLIAAGKTVLLVTHYPEDIVEGIGRVMFIKDGAVFADGPREEMLSPAALCALFDLPAWPPVV